MFAEFFMISFLAGARTLTLWEKVFGGWWSYVLEGMLLWFNFAIDGLVDKMWFFHIFEGEFIFGSKSFSCIEIRNYLRIKGFFDEINEYIVKFWDQAALRALDGGLGGVGYWFFGFDVHKCGTYDTEYMLTLQLNIFSICISTLMTK